jgi:hypothetical protein
MWVRQTMANETPQINMSSIKVAGVGGLGMVIVVCAMAFEMPEVRSFALVSGAGGIVLAATLIAYRRWVKPDGPQGPTLLRDPEGLEKHAAPPPRPGPADDLWSLEAAPASRRSTLGWRSQPARAAR